MSAGTFFWKFAKDECQKRGLRLPTKGEFEDAEKRGIREILKLDRKDSMAWSSTLVNESGDSSNGIVTFDFNNGQLESTSDYNFKANLVCVKN